VSFEVPAYGGHHEAHVDFGKKEPMKRFFITAASILALSTAASASVVCDDAGNCIANSPHAAPAPAPSPPAVVYEAPPSNRAIPVADCALIVHPVHLDRFGDNNLSVHPSPYHPSASTESDELVPGDTVCALPGPVGPWIHIQYLRGGYVHTGWSHAGYLSD
jgi:hypothetical protein